MIAIVAIIALVITLGLVCRLLLRLALAALKDHR